MESDEGRTDGSMSDGNSDRKIGRASKTVADYNPIQESSGIKHTDIKNKPMNSYCKVSTKADNSQSSSAGRANSNSKR